MQVINIKDEDIINYKLTSMFIGFPYCSGKCWKEQKLSCSICQNDSLRRSKIIDISVDNLIQRYLNNPITEAIVCGGLEPIDSFDDLFDFISTLRFKYRCYDKVVIYTGYYLEEISEQVAKLKACRNIVIKFGRYIPNSTPAYNDILGVTLASDNQYAVEFD